MEVVQVHQCSVQVRNGYVQARMMVVQVHVKQVQVSSG